MRVVAPQRVADTGSSTFSTALQRLRPSVPDLVDAAFVLTLGTIALVVWATTFSTGTYLAVGVLGLALGLMIAHVTTVLRWHWITALGLAVALFYALGGAVALRADVIAGFLPSGATPTGLTRMALGGWKDLLTTLPPVPGEGPYLVLPWLVGLAYGTVAHLVARRSRSAWGPPAIAVALTAATILLGTYEGTWPVAVGILATLGAFAWLFVRDARRRALTGSGVGRGTRWASAAALIAVALGAGTGASFLMPSPEQVPRTVLRTWVQPPVDVDRYPSPLAGFRKYSSDSQALYNQPLLKVEGAGAGTLIRMAVLDDYNGTVWSASGGVVGDPRTGFRRVGSRIPGAPEGRTSTVRLTIQPAYAGARELAPWLPAPGPATDLTFTGANARAHEEVVRYNIGTSQGLVPDFLRPGDTVEVTSVALPAQTGQLPRPGGPVQVSDTISAPLAPAVDRLAQAAGDPWSRAVAVASVMRDTGSWSNGSKPGQQQYLPGHGMKRLVTFSTELVGSDEHYAAFYALALNRLGYPARPVLGATVGSDGQVRGRDVRAWVEVNLEGTGWVTIPTETFMPDRNKEPNNIPPKALEQQNAVNVPPPNPSRPPGSFDSLFNTGGIGEQADQPARPRDMWADVIRLVRLIGPPVLLIGTVIGLLLGAKAVRRHRRRTRGEASTQVDGGWREFLDRARDLGRPVPLHATRLEQAAAVGGPEASGLAVAANRAVFGRGEVDAEASGAYWSQVLHARQEVLAGLPFWKKWWVALNPRSLVPLSRDRSAGATGLRRGSRVRSVSPRRSPGR